MADWQPIATAPRDGSEFQVWANFLRPSPHSEWMPRCRYIGEGLQIFDDERGEWQRTSEPYMVATHWMPQPTAPEADMDNTPTTTVEMRRGPVVLVFHNGIRVATEQRIETVNDWRDTPLGPVNFGCVTIGPPRYVFA
jgi:hypothetical protein